MFETIRLLGADRLITSIRPDTKASLPRSRFDGEEVFRAGGIGIPRIRERKPRLQQAKRKIDVTIRVLDPDGTPIPPVTHLRSANEQGPVGSCSKPRHRLVTERAVVGKPYARKPNCAAKPKCDLATRRNGRDGIRHSCVLARHSLFVARRPVALLLRRSERRGQQKKHQAEGRPLPCHQRSPTRSPARLPQTFPAPSRASLAPVYGIANYANHPSVRSRSSAGQSGGFLNRRSEVRVFPGSPVFSQGLRGRFGARGYLSVTGPKTKQYFVHRIKTRRASRDYPSYSAKKRAKASL